MGQFVTAHDPGLGGKGFFGPLKKAASTPPPPAIPQFMVVGADSANLGGTPFIATRSPSSGVWTVQTTSGFDPLNGLFAVAKANGVWVTGSDSNAVAGSQIGYSTDNGVTLHIATNPVVGANFPAAGGSATVALLGIPQGLLFSTNGGVTWTRSNLVGPGSYLLNPQGIAFGNGIYAACGIGSGTNQNILSADGETWAGATYLSNRPRAIIHDGTQFVQVGRSLALTNVVATSPDGNAFTESPINLSPPLSIAWNGAVYVAIERLSSNLIVSATIAGLAGASPAAVATGNFMAITADRTTGLIIAVDDAGFAYSSSNNGSTWTPETTGGQVLTAIGFG